MFRGPNVWSYEPAIHLILDLGSLEEHPTNTITGFTDRLLTLLPRLSEHTCSRGVPGGFVERLREGTWMGHLAEHVALQVQKEAGHELSRGRLARSGVGEGSTTSSTATLTRGSGWRLGSLRCGWSTI